MNRPFQLTGILCLLLLLLWSGCARRADHGQALQNLKTEAATQLFQEARQALWQGRMHEAADLLERFLDHYPRSPLRREAQWWLAWSYKESGNLREALAHYQELAESGSPHPYREGAIARVEELEKALGLISPEDRLVQGLFIPVESLGNMRADPGSGFSVGQASRSGMNAFMLGVGCRTMRESRSASAEKVLTASPNARFPFHALERFVTDAHRRHQEVFVAVDLRCLGYMKPHQAWRDGVYDPVQERILPSPWFDLFHPRYREFLIQWLAMLSRSGIDGMVFHGEAPLGPFDGFTQAASVAFQQAFHESLDPQRFFRFRRTAQVERVKQGVIHLQADQDIFQPRFWRWNGWKARERLRLMEEVANRLHARFPHLMFGIEVHRESIENPLMGLMLYSEDWVAIAQSRFDFFYVKLNDRERSDERGERAVLDQMIGFLEDPKKLWVLVPGQGPNDTPLRERSERGRLQGWLPQGVGRFFGGGPVP